MMINKRLIDTARESKKYIAGNVMLHWCSLAANIVMMGAVAVFLQKLYEGLRTKGVLALPYYGRRWPLPSVLSVQFFSSRMGYLSSKAVKKTLREMIYRKLLRLGASYSEKVQTSEVVQWQ